MAKKEIGLLVLVLVVGSITAILNPRFLSGVNLLDMANLIGLFGIFSIGEGMVIITGGIDLSVGSMFALLGVVFIDLLVNRGVPWPLAILAILVGGVLLGALQGLLVTRAKLQPFVVTLCGLLIYRGAARYYTGDATMGFGYTDDFDWLGWLASGRSLGIPHPFMLLILVAAVMWVLLHRSVFGRYLFAVGRNEEAARFSGIRTGAVDRRCLHHRRRPRRPLHDLPGVLHQLGLAFLLRQFLRAVCHRRRGARRLQLARRRRIHRRHRAWHRAAAGAAEPGEHPGFSEFAQFRRDGNGDPARRAGRPALRLAPQDTDGARVGRRRAPFGSGEGERGPDPLT